MGRNHYQPLASEKYFAAAIQQQAKAVRKERSREAFRACLWGALSLSLMAIALYTMPVWVEAIVDALDNKPW